MEKVYKCEKCRKKKFKDTDKTTYDKCNRCGYFREVIKE